jgi:hypothetical protein
VARHEKQFQQGGEKEQRDAADKLDQARQNAKDEKTREAARQALEKHEQRPGESARPEDAARQAKELESSDPKLRQDAAEKLDRMARNADDPKTREAARQALEKADKKPGQDATPEDVARQKQEFQQGGDKERREAADRLDQMRQNAKDEKTREEARKTMEDLAREMQKEQAPGQAKQTPPEGGPQPSQTGASKKGPPQGQDPQTGTAKQGTPGQQTADQGQPKDGGQDMGTDPTAQAKDEGKAINPLGARQPGTGDAPPDAPIAQNQEPPGGPGDPRHRDRAGTLQLEDFQKVDKKLRDELGWTEEQLKQFQRDYEELLKRRQAEARTAEPDQPQGPQRGGTNLSNIGAQRVKPGQGGPVDARSIGRGQPPPGYQDAAREFYRRLSELDAAPQKR